MNHTEYKQYRIKATIDLSYTYTVDQCVELFDELDNELAFYGIDTVTRFIKIWSDEGMAEYSAFIRRAKHKLDVVIPVNKKINLSDI